MKAKKSVGKTIAKVIAYLLLVVIIVGIIGVVARYTGGFTSGFKTFYVNVDGKDVMTQASGYTLKPEDSLTVDVKYTFSSPSDEVQGYSVMVVPNAIANKDFDFTLDGDIYSFQAENDLTKGFDIEYGESSFTIKPKGTLQEIIQAVYPEYEVGDCSSFGYKDMFTLIVSSYDGQSSVKLNFTVEGSISGVILDKEVIVF